MKKLFAAAIIAGSLSCSKHQPLEEKIVQDKTPFFRCYDQGSNNIYVHTDSQEKRISYSEMSVKKEPLNYFCNNEGVLFWVTESEINIRNFNNGKFDFLLDFDPTKPPEYNTFEGKKSKIRSAGIWKNPQAKMEEVTIATISDNGVLQISRNNLDDHIANNPDRTLFDFKQFGIWPNNLSDVRLNMVGEESFVLLFKGEKGKANIDSIIRISYDGKIGSRFKGRKILVTTIDLKVIYPGLKNIFEILKETYYDKSLGGFVTDLVGEDQKGKTIPVLVIVSDK